MTYRARLFQALRDNPPQIPRRPQKWLNFRSTHTHASAARLHEAHPEMPVRSDVRASTEASGAVLLAVVRPLNCAPNESIFLTVLSRHKVCSRTSAGRVSKLIGITSLQTIFTNHKYELARSQTRKLLEWVVSKPVSKPSDKLFIFTENSNAHFAR